jgi:hypothetical protein
MPEGDRLLGRVEGLAVAGGTCFAVFVNALELDDQGVPINET